MRIKVNVRPPDGRFFVERDGTKITASTWAGVFKRVKLYRKLNRFPAGNVEEEVFNQACQRTPSLCYDQNTQWAPPKRPTESLKARVLGWLSKLSQVTPAYVGAAEAKRRADICMRCPKQGPMEKGCASCKAAVKELRAVNLRGRPEDARLAACSVIGQDNRVAVWIASDRLNDPDLPAPCWRRAE